MEFGHDVLAYMGESFSLFPAHCALSLCGAEVSGLFFLHFRASRLGTATSAVQHWLFATNNRKNYPWVAGNWAWAHDDGERKQWSLLKNCYWPLHYRICKYAYSSTRSVYDIAFGGDFIGRAPSIQSRTWTLFQQWFFGVDNPKTRVDQHKVKYIIVGSDRLLLVVGWVSVMIAQSEHNCI